MKDVEIKLGATPEDAEMSADVLVTADKRGNDTHGIQRFKTVYVDRIERGNITPSNDIIIVKDTPTTAVVDGNNCIGHVVGVKCMKMAIEKAKKYGIGMVVARNSTHYGIAGYYPLMAAKEGCIGMSGTNARSSVAPTFGDEPKLGTNPLACACPSDEQFPWCLDCATSISPTGRFEKFVREGKEVNKTWCAKEGEQELTNPSEFLKLYPQGKAYLYPVGGKEEVTGGYKGYGYSTLVEILSSCLSAASFLSGIERGMKETNKYSLGHFFIAFNVENFRPLDEFKKQVGDVNRELRSAKKCKGHDRIYTAGEKEYDTEMYRKEHGVPMLQTTINEMNELRKKFNLNYTFPWDN